MTALAFRLGDRGPAVAEIRARLARLGFLPGSAYAQTHRDYDPLRSGPSEPQGDPALWQTTGLASAEFDAEVEAAVREFQRQRGITSDGVAGPETLRRLEEARWRLGDRVLSYSASNLTVGEDVLDLQQRLNALGFACGREDGQLGLVTDQAIRDFQRNTGQAADGVCGPATFRCLGQLRRTVGRQSGHAVREKYLLHELQTGVSGKLVVLDPGPRESSDYSDAPPPQTAITARLAGLIEGRLVILGADVLVIPPEVDDGEPESTVEGRARLCNQVGADLVMSLGICHDPSCPGGPATYYYGRETGSHSVPGRLAAILLHDGIASRTGTAGRSSHPRTSDLLRLTRMPAVRIEVGNLADPTDRLRLSDPAHLEALARAVAAAVERFFSPEHVL